jgi:FAD/FMN-containing dehydrogenase
MRASSAVSAFAALLFALLVGIYHEYTHKPPNPVDINEMETFSNFGQTFTMRFGQPPKGSGLPRNKFSQPTSEKEIVDTVRAAAKAGHVVRVFGAGHSWTPLVAGSKNRATHLLNLDNYNRLVAVDVEKRQATVQAGIRVRQLTRSLASVGLGLSNMGTIDEQSIAGAISTSTHGSGMKLRISSVTIDCNKANAT